jgi:hypothetical protein
MSVRRVMGRVLEALHDEGYERTARDPGLVTTERRDDLAVGVPWLERVADPSAAHADGVAEAPVDAAELAWVAGDRDLARRHLAEAETSLAQRLTETDPSAPSMVRLGRRVERLRQVLTG